MYKDVELINIDNYVLDHKLAEYLSEKQIRKFETLVLAEEAGRVVLGMVDPKQLLWIDELSRILKRPLRIVRISREDFEKRCADLYQQSNNALNNSLMTYADKLVKELSNYDRNQMVQGDEPAVIQLLGAIFEYAIQNRASDIHIEPAENLLRIRLRVDGLLNEQVLPLEGKKTVVAALTQRLKLMAHLNISEKRLPQDGRFNLEIKGVRFGVRLSTLPVQYGESIVMRILRKGTQALSLESSGMSGKTLQDFRSLIHAPNGIILATGPTGSGKTTTLYGALSEINDVSKNIITIEDPIEYELNRANQVQVNTNIGLTFAEALRSVLRQDPDVILIGEIRDHETAEIALRSALTGHTVFSTLHTNDAAGVAERLIDMGLEPYLVAAALRGALAQRLVRTVCPHCVQEYLPLEKERIFFEGKLGEQFHKHSYVRGAGCKYCQGTGYLGMKGVYELLILDDELRFALKRGGAEFNEVLNSRKNRSTLFNSAFELAAQHLISLDEVLKLVGA